MKVRVIDASVAIKWFLPEKGAEQAGTLLKEIDQFMVPDLFFIEFDSILSKKVRKRELEITEAEEIYTVLRRLPFITTPYERHSKEIFFLSTRFPITQYDACYLTLAIEYNGIFYTADKRLLSGISNTAYSDYIVGIIEKS